MQASFIEANHRRVYSQNEEDGVIAYLLQVLEVSYSDHFYVEIGTEDGVQCNTRWLREQGMRGWMFDNDNENLFIGLYKKTVTSSNLKPLLDEFKITEQKIAVFSIDVDSFDLWLFRAALDCVRPKLFVVERNDNYGSRAGTFPNETPLNFQWKPEPHGGMGQYCLTASGLHRAGAGYVSLDKVAQASGYQRVYSGRVNLYYVAKLDLPSGFRSPIDFPALRVECLSTRAVSNTVHLTCKDKNNVDNPVWQHCLAQYNTVYRAYEIRVWDDHDLFKLLDYHYPQHTAKVRKIRIGAVLADIFRYLVLYLEGGVYSDMDCEPIRCIDELWGSCYYHGDSEHNLFIYPEGTELKSPVCDFHFNPCHQCDLLGVEDKCRRFRCKGHFVPADTKVLLCYEFHSDWHKNTVFLDDSKWTVGGVGVCQWFMVAQSKQPIFLKMFLHCMQSLDAILALDPFSPQYHKNVINLTGPRAFTKIVLENMDDGVVILPSDFFCVGSGCGKVPKTNNCFAHHHFTFSWGPASQ